MGLKRYKNLTWQTKGQTWPVHWLSQTRTNGRYNAFAAPSPPRDWHGGPFPTHGELAQGLSLTMRPTRTASLLCFFPPQWPESWLSPAFCANILVHFEVCFQYIYIYIFNNYSLKSRWIVAKYLPSRESGEVNIPKATIHRDWKE